MGKKEKGDKQGNRIEEEAMMEEGDEQGNRMNEKEMNVHRRKR